MVDTLKQYKELLDAGLITEDEYNAKKQEVLASENQAEAPAQPQQPVQPQGFQPQQPAQPVVAPQPVQPQQGFQSQQSQGYYQNQQQYSNPVPGYVSAKPAKSKVVAGVLGILLGGLGIHKFYLGYSKEGLIMLLVSVLLGFVGIGLVMGIVGLIEGIMYLVKPDAEFDRIYVQGHKGWF